MPRKSTHGTVANFVGIIDGRFAWDLPSQSRPGEANRLTCNPDGTDPDCDCAGSRWHGHCGGKANAPTLAEAIRDQLRA